jgi:hypothetical protein
MTGHFAVASASADFPHASDRDHAIMPYSTYTSADGRLTFTVARREDGVVLGFEGFAWHTHADLLVGSFGPSEEIAVERYVSALLANQLLIAMVRDERETLDVFITRDPQSDLRYKPADERLEFRYWDGSPWPA